MVSEAVTIALVVVAAVAVISLPLTIPVLGFQFLFWRMHLILDNIPESELMERTIELPEVKTIQSQLLKPEPDTDILKKSWGALKMIATIGSVANVIDKVKTAIEQAIGGVL